jgi:hypothetical protein
LDVRYWRQQNTAIKYMMRNSLISRLLLAKYYDDGKITEEIGMPSSIQTFGVRT